MVTVSDYIMQRLVDFGVTHVFMVTGGGAMHLNDSVGKQSGLKYVCHHHEQACAMAAEGYARATGKPAVVLVTTGPGGLNTLSGVMGQWTDSVPVIYISGQVKTETTINYYPDLKLRQMGDQEVDITKIVKPIIKYAANIYQPDIIRNELEKAWSIAKVGRPGPVWLNIPLDIQGAKINPDTLKPFTGHTVFLSKTDKNIEMNLSRIMELLSSAARPIIIAGHGIRIAGAEKVFRSLLNILNIPVVTSFNGFDLLPSKHPQYIGRIGTIGNRAGNFALQNADLAFFLGTRNNIRQISYNYTSFARSAKTIVVDIDSAELEKPTLIPDIAVHADVASFIKKLADKINENPITAKNDWLNWCQLRKNKYPIVTPVSDNNNMNIDPYWFMNILSSQIDNNSIIITSNGTASVAYFQSGIVKAGHRVIWNSGCASMGYGLPAAIGASFGTNRQVICIEGDGSLMMNLQELQTLAHHNLQIKLFVLNNEGYHSIRQTQDNFFDKRRVGCDPESGISFPKLEKIAIAFDLTYSCITKHENMPEKIAETLTLPGPILCEVLIDPTKSFSPKTSSIKRNDGKIVSRPIEDMAPFLDRKEFLSNMIVKPLSESLD